MNAFALWDTTMMAEHVLFVLKARTARNPIRRLSRAKATATRQRLALCPFRRVFAIQGITA
jgi:hypothetical protein